MLRLEKKSHGRPVSVSIREKRRLLTPTFLRALALAMTLHFFAIVIFPVQPFKISHIKSIFPPIQVNIALEPMDGAALAHLQKKQTKTVAISESAPSTPNIPSFSFTKIIRHLAYPKVKFSPVNPFSKIEENMRYLDLMTLSKVKSTSGKRPIEIKVFGDLSRQEILEKGWEKQDLIHWQTSRKSLKQQRIIYDVKVEDRTGKIFWYMPQAGSEQKRLNMIAERILCNMKFHANPQGFISQGKLEILFTFSEKEK